MVERKVSQYRIVGRLGSEGMDDVYKAEDTNTQPAGTAPVLLRG